MSDEFGHREFDLNRWDELCSGSQSWRLLYLKATICPCRHPSDGSPSKNCTRCKGLGFTWADLPPQTVRVGFYQGSETVPPILADRNIRTADLEAVTDEDGNSYPDAQVDPEGQIVFPTTRPAHAREFFVEYTAPPFVRGHIAGLTQNRKVEDGGNLEAADLNLTLAARYRHSKGAEWLENPAFDADENDRFVVLDARTRFQQVLYREDRGRDRLLYAYVYEVEKVFSLTPSFDRVDYAQTTDYTLEGGRVVWVSGRGPEKGQPYSVVYTCAPEFWVFRSRNLIRHQNSDPQPRRLSLKKWALFPNAAAVTR